MKLSYKTKLFSSVSIICVIIASCTLGEAGSNISVVDNEIKFSYLENKSEIAKSYEYIGYEHNDILADVYSELNDAQISKEQRGLESSNLNSIEVSTIINDFFHLDQSIQSRNLSDINEDDINEDDINEDAKIYIDRIKLTIQDSDEDLEVLIYEIELIEEEAIIELISDSLDQFMSYSATARASLMYWTLNIEKWDALLTGEYVDGSRGFWSNLGKKIKKLWDENKRRIKYFGESDAAGALVGALIGGSYGSTIPGIGTSIGAGIGAGIVAGASSAKAWETASFCLVIPYTDIYNKIDKKNSPHDPEPDLGL